LPNVPTTVELGFADSDYMFWNGMLAPATTLAPVIERLHAEVQKALRVQRTGERGPPNGFTNAARTAAPTALASSNKRRIVFVTLTALSSLRDPMIISLLALARSLAH
jgi:tripartite-type tricarboxylate transporter receptor subunit TctC